VVAKEMLDPVGAVALTRFARLAARVLEVPLVHIALVDAQHRWVESGGDGGAPHAGFLTNLKIPLRTWDGRQVGTLTLKDRRPRRWSASQTEFLKELSVRIVGSVDIGSPDQVM
jgi:hypothetical protein